MLTSSSLSRWCVCSTAALLDLLKSKAVVGTLFVTGAALGGNTSLLARAVAEGHSLASQTYASVILNSALAGAVLEADVAANEAALRAASCVDPNVIHPPLGVTTNSLVQTLLVRLSFGCR